MRGRKDCSSTSNPLNGALREAPAAHARGPADKEGATTIQFVDYPTLALVLALSLINYAVRFARWAVYLGDPRRPVPAGRHFAIYLAGFALTPTPSKAGEALRAFYLRPFGIGYGRCLAMLYAERILDVLAISLLATLVITSSGGALRWTALLGVLVSAALLALQHPRVHATVDRALRRARWQRIRNAGPWLRSFRRDVLSLMRPRLVTRGTFLGLVAWGAEGVGLWLIAQALGIDIGMWTAIGIYATATLAGALSFLPGGLGSTEVVMTALLVSGGASVPAAVSATLVCRLATLWFAVAIGAVAWLGITAFSPSPPATPSLPEQTHGQ